MAKAKRILKENQQKEKRVVQAKRNFIVLAILSCLLCFLGYRSLNIYENVYGNANPTLESATGYQVDGTVYTLTDPENNILTFSIPEEAARGFYMYFVEPIGVDTTVTANLMYQGATIKHIETVIPAADSYIAFVFGNSNADKIEVSIDGNFNYASAVTEILFMNEDGQKQELLQNILAVLVVFIILSGICCRVSFIDTIITNIQEGIQNFIKNVGYKKKEILQDMEWLGISIVLGTIVWFIIEEFILKKDWTWSRNSLLFGTMVGVLGFLFYRYFRRKEVKFERMFLASGLVMGTVLAIILPLHLNLSWDDQIHYQNATVISHIKSNAISMSESDFYQSCFFPLLKNYGEWNLEEMANVLNDADSNVTASAEIPYVISYNSIVYFPVAFALFIVRGLGIPLSMCVVLGRMASAWFYFIVLYFGMKRLKTGKMVMAAVSLLPISLFIVSNYNYDYWLIAMTGYSIAYLVGEYQQPEKQLTVKDILLIFIPFILGSIAKPVYIPLLGLAAFLPKEKFRSVKFRRGYHGFFAGVVLCAILGFAVLLFGDVLGTGDVRGGTEVNAPMQIQYIISNPLEYTKTLLNFLKGYLSFSSIKWDLVDTAYIPVKEWLGIPVMISLVLICILDRDKEENKKIKWYLKASVPVLAFVTICCVATSMYVVFTPVGDVTVAGCSGRYIIPVILPFLLVLSRVGILTVPQTEKAKRWIECIAMLVTVILSGIMMTYFV